MSVVQTSLGRRLYYDDIGTGPPILLIPGMSGDRRGCLTWLANALATRLRVVSMDIRDSGESDIESNDYTLADMTSDAVTLLDALEIDRAHVFGHSLGGRIAMEFALGVPDRLDRLVLMSATADLTPYRRIGEPTPPPDDWWVDEPVERFRGALPYLLGPGYLSRASDEELRAIAALERDNRATWAGTVRQSAAAAENDVPDRLGEIRAPTLVIHGDADESDCRLWGSALAAAIPGARLLSLPEVGHLPWVEQPGLVNPAILNFVAETDGSNA